jgi:hypothetical protein
LFKVGSIPVIRVLKGTMSVALLYQKMALLKPIPKDDFVTIFDEGIG